VNPIFATASEIEAFCRSQAWQFCFIGALAVQRWGEPRLTQDVDLTVVTGFGGEAGYVDALLGRFKGRLADAREFALVNRVLLLESHVGIPIDVALGAMPFEERAARRASAFSLQNGVALTTCGAEDLIVLKTFAGRDKDWLDIEGIVLRQSGQLDENLIWRELVPLLELKEAPEASARLRSILARGRPGGT
jgi:hypothetical protein